jgi:single-strand DNA-binding protein
MLAKATIIGNLGRDPETRYTKNGSMNVSFSVATNRKWTDQSGQEQEKTTWFRVTAWGKLAETLARLMQDDALVKGKQVYVSGRLDLDEYTGQDGTPRASLELTADEVQLLGSRGEDRSFGSREAPGTPVPISDAELPF